MKGFFGTIFGTAVGSKVLSQPGISSAHGVVAMGKVSGMFPAWGAVKGAGMIMKPLKKLGGVWEW